MTLILSLNIHMVILVQLLKPPFIGPLLYDTGRPVPFLYDRGRPVQDQSLLLLCHRCELISMRCDQMRQQRGRQGEPLNTRLSQLPPGRGG